MYKNLGQSNLFGLLPEHYDMEIKARMGLYDAPEEFLTDQEREEKKWIDHCKKLQAEAAAKKQAKLFNKFFA